MSVIREDKNLLEIIENDIVDPSTNEVLENLYVIPSKKEINFFGLLINNDIYIKENMGRVIDF